MKRFLSFFDPLNFLFFPISLDCLALFEGFSSRDARGLCVSKRRIPWIEPARRVELSLEDPLSLQIWTWANRFQSVGDPECACRRSVERDAGGRSPRADRSGDLECPGCEFEKVPCGGDLQSVWICRRVSLKRFQWESVWRFSLGDLSSLSLVCSVKWIVKWIVK